MSSGSSSSASLISVTVPEIGATIFDTDFTDSITPISSKDLNSLNSKQFKNYFRNYIQYMTPRCNTFGKCTIFGSIQ